VSIGTGGPFGAEGPIIATGGALGSLLGQIIRTTATERKTLLAAGAAAGMAATFGSPVSAVLLAIELLLFEFRPRSIIPVALASANTEWMVSGRIVGEAVLFLCAMKFISWAIALGSGTSGGTLAPLFTIGGGCGVLLGEVAALAFPRFHVDPRICALVGMAAM